MSSSSTKHPPLLLYSLLLPAVWFTVGGVMYGLFPGSRLGVVGLVLIVIFVVWLISWHLAKTFRRHFSTSERVRLIVYCSLWAVIAELWALYSYVLDLHDAGETPLELKYMVAVVAFTVVVDTLIMWAAITGMAKKFTDSQLSKYVRPGT